MRTTVTLDPEVETLLKNEAHRTKQSFKAVLNQTVLQSLGKKAAPSVKPFVVKATPMGLKPGIDPLRLSELADDLEVDAHLTLAQRGSKRAR
jgi:hypothetical protein